MTIDTPENILRSSNAPKSEIHDATIELHQKYLPDKDLVKAVEQLAKSIQDESQRKEGSKSHHYDLFTGIMKDSYIEKPSGFTFNDLRYTCYQTPLLSSIISTRASQISRFSKLQEHPSTPGFIIRHRDINHKITPEEEVEIGLISQFITNCGWEFSPKKRKRIGRSSFTEFLTSSVQDSLILDANPIELEINSNMGNRIEGFYQIDGATIRLCPPDGYKGDPDISAVQLVYGKVETTYTDDNLIYVPRNVSTDIRLCGYGRSEIELMPRIITGYLNALTYNISGFDKNSIPKGIWTALGSFTEESLSEFERKIKYQLTGAQNSWATIFMTSMDPNSKIMFNKIDDGFSDIHFERWFSFLTAVGCAIYKISPEEIGFGSFNDTGGLINSSYADRISSSKDKGLMTLISHYESIITDYIISEISPKYVFRFTGVNPVDQTYQNQLSEKIKTINELRAEQGLSSLGGLGDRLLSEQPKQSENL